MLGVGLAEFFADAESLDASVEYASLAAEIAGARETEGGGEVDFGGIQFVAIGIIAEIEHLTFPIGLQSLYITLDCGDGWRIIRQRSEIGLIPIGADDTRWFWCGARGGLDTTVEGVSRL